MATKREKQLVTILLKERIEHATGKKVVLKENKKRILKEETELDPNTPVRIQVTGEKYDGFNSEGGPFKKTYTSSLERVLKRILEVHNYKQENLKTIEEFVKILKYSNGDGCDFVTEVKMLEPEKKILFSDYAETGKKVVIEEGTWILPRTKVKIIEVQKSLDKIKSLRKELYDILRDDELLDCLDKALIRGKRLVDYSIKNLKQD